MSFAQVPDAAPPCRNARKIPAPVERFGKLPRHRRPDKNYRLPDNVGITHVRGKLNGALEILHLDTCASPSTISSACARLHDIPIKPCPILRSTTGIGGQARILGIANVEIEVAGIKTPMVVQVVEHQAFTILLGPDYLLRAGGVLDYDRCLFRLRRVDRLQRKHWQALDIGIGPSFAPGSIQQPLQGSRKALGKRPMPQVHEPNTCPTERLPSVTLTDKLTLPARSCVDVHLNLPVQLSLRGEYLLTSASQEVELTRAVISLPDHAYDRFTLTNHSDQPV